MKPNRRPTGTAATQALPIRAVTQHRNRQLAETATLCEQMPKRLHRIAILAAGVGHMSRNRMPLCPNRTGPSAVDYRPTIPAWRRPKRRRLSPLSEFQSQKLLSKKKMGGSTVRWIRPRRGD
jgi:hypothetical protein